MEGEAIEKKKQLDVKQAEITIKKVRLKFFANKNSTFLFYQGEADIELAAALPALEEARKAVKEITNTQVAEIR
jgi:hypothetical protein